MNVTKRIDLDRLEGTTQNRTPQVGDAMILQPRNDTDGAITGNVCRVTKRQFRVTGTDGNEYGPFRLEAWNLHECVLEDGSYAGYDSTEPATQYGWQLFESWERKSYAKYTSCTFKHEWLMERAAKVKAKAELRRDEKQAAEDKRRREYAERIARELAEVKEACDNTGLPDLEHFYKIMPDGSRIYTVDIPVHPNFAERKKGWERVIVRCWAGEGYDWQKHENKPVTKSAYTYCNGSSSSFSSVSTDEYASDEDAVWDAIRSRYYNWW